MGEIWANKPMINKINNFAKYKSNIKHLKIS